MKSRSEKIRPRIATMPVIMVRAHPIAKASLSLDGEADRNSRTNRRFSKGTLRTHPGAATSPFSRKKKEVAVSTRLR